MAGKTYDKFATLSAIWIMASNDENPIITYEGLKYRLGLPENFDIRALVKEHGELFRLGAPRRRLEEWKQEMRLGRHLPSWVREIDDENGKKEMIDSLSSDNVFRSQFRAEENADRSSLEILDWGVRHIERLRRAEIDIKDRSAKSWELWVVFGVGILNFLATILVVIFK